MNVDEAIKTRKSIRGFRPEPVDRAVIEEILRTAGRAPSTLNTQPWEFFVLAGEVAREAGRRNVECLRAGAPGELEVTEGTWPRDSVYRKRQVALAKQLFERMGIAREDRARRSEWMERGFRYFDAPVVIIIVMDRSLTGEGPLLDIGGVMQNICLAAWERGLGTCIARQGVVYSHVLREVAGIPESKRIIISIAIGYPDWDFPANQVESDREPIEAITTWVGFT